MRPGFVLEVLRPYFGRPIDGPQSVANQGNNAELLISFLLIKFF